MIGNLPTGDEEMAAAIRDGHLEENPENKNEVRITTAGLARFMILESAAEAYFESQEEEPKPDELADEPEVEPAPPPTEAPIEESPE